MGILNFFRSKPDTKSANVAKERLQVIIAHERIDRSGPDYLPQMKSDILAVIKRYVPIGDDQVRLNLDSKDGDFDVLELEITLPDSEDARRDALATS